MKCASRGCGNEAAAPGGHALRKASAGDRRKEETRLQHGIVDALLAMGLIALRLNSGRVKVRGGYLHLCPKGTADVFAQLRDGRAAWAEIKTQDGERTPEQVDFQRAVERHHGVYVLARSLEDVLVGFGLQEAA